jgi:hypothetical protein
MEWNMKTFLRTALLGSVLLVPFMPAAFAQQPPPHHYHHHAPPPPPPRYHHHSHHAAPIHRP